MIEFGDFCSNSNDIDFSEEVKNVNQPESVKNKLNDESVEVQKLLSSFGCKNPVSPECEAQPSSFKQKFQPEDAHTRVRI